MSASKKHHRSARKAREKAEHARVPTALRASAIGALTAFLSALILLLTFTALSLGTEDPTARSPILGLVSLGVSSLAAGIAFELVSRGSPLGSTALGTAIAVVVLAVSFTDALPSGESLLSKPIALAVLIVCATVGGMIAKPKQGRHRRRT